MDIIKTVTGIVRKTSIMLALAIFLPLAAISKVTHPLYLDGFEIDYDLNWQKAVANGDFTYWPTVGPFYYSTFDNNNTQNNISPTLKLISTPENNNIRLFALTTELLSSRRNEKTRDLPSLAGGIRYQPSDCFGASVLFNLDRAKALDPDYTGKKWRGLAGDIETAAIYYKKGNLGLTLGRERVFWGPRPTNLILSQSADPLDLFSARYKKGRLQFSFLFARLDESRPDSTDVLRLSDQTFNDNRYFVGHRLDIKFHKRFRLGLFETSLFGGEGRPPELYYLNPLQFFHTAQLNEDTDDNTILGFDFTWLVRNNWALYGQMIIDDYQIDNKSQGDQEPDEIGVMCGLFKAGHPGSISPDLRLEYVRITNRTYHQAQPRNRYLFRNRLLGHPLGNDADSLSLAIRFWPDTDQFIELEMAYVRHGEGSIYSSWDDPWEDVEGDFSEPFPTGTVEKAILAALRIKGYLPLGNYSRNHIFISLEGGCGSYNNYLNIKDNDKKDSWLNLSLSWIGALEFGTGE